MIDCFFFKSFMTLNFQALLSTFQQPKQLNNIASCLYLCMQSRIKLAKQFFQIKMKFKSIHKSGLRQSKGKLVDYGRA
jgi:hypothetical protein